MSNKAQGPARVKQQASDPAPDRTVVTLREAMVAETLSEVVKQHQSILATEQRLIVLHDNLTALADKIEMRAERYGKIIAALNQAGFERYTTGLAEQTHATLRELTDAIKHRASTDAAESLEPQARPSVANKISTFSDQTGWLGGRWALFSGVGLLFMASAIAGVLNI